jgi:hypothetical protein
MPTALAPKERSSIPKEQSTARDPGVASEAKFIPSQGADQRVFTNFRETNVLGPGDATVGPVNDLLFDGTGKIIGVVPRHRHQERRH